MQNELIIRRSPIVLIGKFAAVEAVGFILYFIATLFGGTKYEIYTQLSLSNFLSYQVAKILFLTIAQFALTVYAFLSWYYEEYIVRSGTVLHQKGVFRKKEESFPVDQHTKLAVIQGFFGRLFRCGSVRAENGKGSFVFSTVSLPERVIKAVHGEFGASANMLGKRPDIARLLMEVEHDQLEFKSSLRFDYKAGKVSRDLEKAVMKTVAAFLNSRGGHLVIGVNDARKPIGLENDYQTLQRKDSDGFENHFTQAFNNMIGPEFRNLIKLWFHNVDGHEICVVQVLPGPRPAYLKIDNSEHFYMRTGNISTALKLSEIESYSRSRWPRLSN